jgi:pyruvate formate lyase activating enzyme
MGTTRGLVFDIREFTLHDGPGIRTTVFLKGCLLRCAWCHNPEGLSPEPQVLHSPAGDRRCGRYYEPEELGDVLARQAPLFQGGGGVTFSGGEPALQAAFLAEVMDRLHGIHIVLDTSGYVGEQEFRLAARLSTLVLFDLKLIDPEEHLRWTGARNKPILRNLAILADMGKPFVIRIPLIPGVTDTPANMGSTAERLRGLTGLRAVELAPFNRAAGGKYPACDLTWKPGFDETLPPRADLEAFAGLGVPVRVL